jgi:hypothetical protein
MLISHVAINSSDNESLNNHLCHLLYSHISFTNKFLKLNKENNIIDESTHQIIIREEKKKWDFLINHKDFTLKDQLFPSFDRIFTEMENHKDMKILSGVHDLYSYYSKYEHFGIQTYFMQRDNSEIDIARINRAIYYCLFGMKIILKYLKEDDYVKDIDALIVEL